MPAGELADLLMDCPDKAIIKMVRKVHEEEGLSYEEIHARLQENIVSDPIYLASYVPKDRVQVYVALFDRVVENTLAYIKESKAHDPANRVTVSFVLQTDNRHEEEAFKAFWEGKADSVYIREYLSRCA